MIQIVEPQTTALEERTTGIVDRAEELIVATNADLVDAGDWLIQVKRIRAEIGEAFDEPIKAAHGAHKVMLAAKKKYDDPMARAEVLIKRKVGAYQQEQERKRREEEVRQQAAARRQEEERRLREAEALEQEGRNDEAEQVVAEPIETPVVVVPATTPKVAGMSTRAVWKWRVKDKALVPREYLKLDDVGIGQRVRAMKDRHGIPGIEAFEETGVAIRV